MLPRNDYVLGVHISHEAIQTAQVAIQSDNSAISAPRPVASLQKAIPPIGRTPALAGSYACAA